MKEPQPVRATSEGGMEKLDAERLVAACADDSEHAGIRMWAALEPTGGPGTAIKPPTYAGAVYQSDRRWWGHGDERRAVDVLVLDNEPSQANRLEAALERRADELGLPRIELDMSEAEPLPPQLPRRLSSFRFPHRQADAYLRDAVLDGTKFPQTEIGQAIFAGTADNPDAILAWFPQALLFGFWQSHLGKQASASQAKLARSWRSSIVGYEPAATGTRQYGLKGDAYNLTLGKEGKVERDPLDESDWEPADKPAKGKDSAKLSEIGHGQVPIGEGGQPPGLAAVSFRAIEQTASVSFADLRRVWFGGGDRNAAGRALLVALGLVAHLDAFGRAFSLRSDCDLRPREARWTWLGARADEDVEIPTVAEVVEVFRACVDGARAQGLPVGDGWRAEPLVLRPAPQLLRVFRATYPVEA